MAQQKEPIVLTCKRCKNTWSYRGTNPYFAACSYCKTSVPLPKHKPLQSGQDLTQAQTAGTAPIQPGGHNG